jgi:hypothetical protein
VVAVDVVARLRPRHLEIEEAILAHILDDMPDPVGVEDPEYMAGRRETVTAVVEYGLVGLEQGEGWSGPTPPVAVAQARRAACLGVSLETVLCRYIAGYKLLVEFVTREAEEFCSERGVLAHLLGLQASLLQRLVSSITCEYTSDDERIQRSPEQRRADLVQRLLAGGSVDASELGYKLDVWHLGLIAQGTGARQALDALAASVGRRLLSVPQDDAVVCAWLGGRRRIAAGDIERVLSAEWPLGFSLAVGEPARGVDGWRTTHRQALEAFWALPKSKRLTRYADVALLAPVLADDLAARSLREIYLAPLGARRGRGAEARQTLRAYFKAGDNAATAAIELGVTAKTVGRRLREIEKRLGRLRSTCRAELEVALRLEELDDAADQLLEG